jgi:hypothetical protein
MSDRDGSPAMPAGGHAGNGGRILAAALALAVLAGCEHGQLSFNRDTGQFSVPIGQGSNR